MKRVVSRRASSRSSSLGSTVRRRRVGPRRQRLRHRRPASPRCSPPPSAAARHRQHLVQITWAAPGGAARPHASTWSAGPRRRPRPSAPSSAPTVTCDDTGLTGSTTYSYTVEVACSAPTGPRARRPPCPRPRPAPPTSRCPRGRRDQDRRYRVQRDPHRHHQRHDDRHRLHRLEDDHVLRPVELAVGLGTDLPRDRHLLERRGHGSVTLKDAETATLAATDGTTPARRRSPSSPAPRPSSQFSSSSVAAPRERSPWATAARSSRR